MEETEEVYSVAQIRAAFAAHAWTDDWGTPALYESGLIDALRYDAEVV